MYCANCGSPFPDIAKFCPKCGKTVRHEKKSPAQPARPVSVRPAETADRARRNADPAETAAKAGRNVNPAGKTLSTEMTADRIAGVIAAVLMTVTVFVPFITRDFLIFKQSDTLFTLLEGESAALNGMFIAFYIVSALLFIVFKFTWKTKKPSLIGCFCSWLILSITGMSVITSTGSDPDGVLYLGAGFYLLIAACVMESISLSLDRRKADGDELQES